MPSHIIYIMGVSGAGKTTIGQLLSSKIGIPFFDADDFHSPSNKEKMKAGIPLTDDDRMDWLLQLHQLALKQSKTQGAIIACSALKEKYRTILANDINPFWVFLQGTYQQLYDRMKNRQGHYMSVELLQSQLDTLEIPVDAFTLSIMLTPDEIVNKILIHINQNQ